jgi:DNA-directed RNA polymerase specialized sigma24 family protein
MCAYCAQSFLLKQHTQELCSASCRRGYHAEDMTPQTLIDVDPEDWNALMLFDLTRRIARQFPRADAHGHAQAVHDALLDYGARPQAFDAGRGVPLLAFLLMTCRRNMLNLLRGDARRRRYEGQYAQMCADVAVALDPAAGNLLQQEEDAQLHQQEDACMNRLQDPQDQQILALRLQGERRTEAFAAILGITHLAMAEQRREVKRAKDRIAKMLVRERLGAGPIMGGARTSKDAG